MSGTGRFMSAPSDRAAYIIAVYQYEVQCTFVIEKENKFGEMASSPNNDYCEQPRAIRLRASCHQGAPASDRRIQIEKKAVCRNVQRAVYSIQSSKDLEFGEVTIILSYTYAHWQNIKLIRNSSYRSKLEVFHRNWTIPIIGNGIPIDKALPSEGECACEVCDSHLMSPRPESPSDPH